MTVPFIQQETGGLVTMAAPNIAVPHGFTTRLGGVSQGALASLNLGENRGDAPERVTENYRRLRAALGIEKLVFTRQVHGTLVRRVSSADAREPYGPPPAEADGLVTDEEGLSLIVFIADCIPVLLYDPVRGAIGAVHAGWRGTVGDICGAAVRAMVRLGSEPKNIRAAIGPGISRCCFETGPEVPKAVMAVLGREGRAYIDAPGKDGDRFFVDLKGVNRALLLRGGLAPENIAVSDECTVCRHDKYWSHRYTHGERGSQAAVITLGRRG